MLINTQQEFVQALDNQESVIELVEGVSVQFDRDISVVTHALKVVVPQASQILQQDGTVWCRCDLGTSASYLNGYQEDAQGNQL